MTLAIAEDSIKVVIEKVSFMGNIKSITSYPMKSQKLGVRSVECKHTIPLPCGGKVTVSD